MPVLQLPLNPAELFRKLDAGRCPIERQTELVRRNLRLLQILILFRMIKKAERPPPVLHLIQEDLASVVELLVKQTGLLQP